MKQTFKSGSMDRGKLNRQGRLPLSANMNPPNSNKTKATNRQKSKKRWNRNTVTRNRIEAKTQTLKKKKSKSGVGLIKLIKLISSKILNGERGCELLAKPNEKKEIPLQRRLKRNRKLKKTFNNRWSKFYQRLINTSDSFCVVTLKISRLWAYYPNGLWQ